MCKIGNRIESCAGLLTGCYPNRVGFSGALFPGHEIGINPEELTIAEMFKEQYNVAEHYPEKLTGMMDIVEKAHQELSDLNVGIEKGSENREIEK